MKKIITMLSLAGVMLLSGCSGVKKLLKHFNLSVGIPMIEEKKEPDKDTRFLFMNEKLKQRLSQIREEAEAISQITYLLDKPTGYAVTKEFGELCINTLKSRISAFSNLSFSLSMDFKLALPPKKSVI